MSSLLDKRRLYALLFALGGLWQLPHARDGPAGAHLMAFGAACLAVSAGLVARRRWARLLACVLVGATVVFTVVKSWVLLGEPVRVARVVLELLAVWGVWDLARMDVTVEEEGATKAAAAASEARAAGRRRAQLAHLREHLEAVEESVRELHERQGHALPFDACADAECADLRQRIAATRGTLDQVRRPPAPDP